MKNFLLMGLAMMLGGCASNEIKIDSTPRGADVLLIRADKTTSNLGKTPISITLSNLDTDGNGVEIVLRKDDYYNESIFIPVTKWPTSGNIFFDLKQSALKNANDNNQSISELRNITNMQTMDKEKALYEMASGIAKSQYMIYKKDYFYAEQELKALLSKFPNISVIHDLLGNIYYMQKDLDKALGAYQMSNKIKPNNPETLNMIDKIQKIKGVQGPSGQTN